MGACSGAMLDGALVAVIVMVLLLVVANWLKR